MPKPWDTAVSRYATKRRDLHTIRYAAAYRNLQKGRPLRQNDRAEQAEAGRNSRKRIRLCQKIWRTWLLPIRAETLNPRCAGPSRARARCGMNWLKKSITFPM